MFLASQCNTQYIDLQFSNCTTLKNTHQSFYIYLKTSGLGFCSGDPHEISLDFVFILQDVELAKRATRVYVKPFVDASAMEVMVTRQFS